MSLFKLHDLVRERTFSHHVRNSRIFLLLAPTHTYLWKLPTSMGKLVASRKTKASQWKTRLLRIFLEEILPKGKKKKRKRRKIFTIHKCVERPRHRTSAVATILLTSSQVPELRSSLRGSKFWKLCIRSTSSRIIGSRENSLQKKSSSSIRRKETPLRIQHIQIYFNSYFFFFFFFCKFYSPELQLFIRRFAPWRIQKCLLTHSLLFNPFTIRMFHGLCRNKLKNILRLLLVRIYFFWFSIIGKRCENWEFNEI